MDREKYFPNEIENSLNQKTVSRNYFPSNLDTEATDNWMSKIRKVEGKYFIELAIFIDRDLFKIMSENFPLDTEEHIIQVVLAMINAVSILISRYKSIIYLDMARTIKLISGAITLQRWKFRCRDSISDKTTWNSSNGSAKPWEILQHWQVPGQLL